MQILIFIFLSMYFSKWHNIFLLRMLTEILRFFLQRGGGLAQSKKSLSEKTEVVKKGGGRVSVFLIKVKKQFLYASPNGLLPYYFFQHKDRYILVKLRHNVTNWRIGATNSNQLPQVQPTSCQRRTEPTPDICHFT